VYRLKALCLLTVVLVMSVPLLGLSGELKPVSFEIGLDYIGSPGLQDFVDDAYSDFSETSDLSGWLGLRAAARFNIGDYVAICPGVSAVFHGISVEVIGGTDPREEDYAMYLIVPNVVGKASVFRGDAVSIFLGGELNYNIADGGSDVFGFEGGGVGFGAFAGINLLDHAEVQLGYEYLPVDVSQDMPLRTGGRLAEDYDFGGVQFSLKYVF